uniref:Uncharacterized protein n=1 Tax=Arundo donax TaxID=35708 RepID=A0A0A9CD44_ARUDO
MNLYYMEELKFVPDMQSINHWFNSGETDGKDNILEPFRNCLSRG